MNRNDPIGEQIKMLMPIYSLSVYLEQMEVHLYNQFHNYLGTQLQDQLWSQVHDSIDDRRRIQR